LSSTDATGAVPEKVSPEESLPVNEVSPVDKAVVNVM
jgi:hypothetical protein